MPEGQKRNNCFFVAGCQSAALFEAAKKAFYLVAVPVSYFVQVEGFHPIRPVWNDGFNAVLGTVGPVFVAVIGRVGQHFAWLQVGQQGQGLRRVARLASCSNQANAMPLGLEAGVYFGADAAPAAAEALGFGVTFFWPAECWWARRMVESSMTHARSGDWTPAKRRSQMPRFAMRRNRRHTELDLPKRSGKSAQGQPVRAIQRMALQKRRLSLAVTPQSVFLPDK